MKRHLLLALACCSTFLLAAPFAALAEVKAVPSVQMDFVFGFTDNYNLRRGGDERDHFFARQRARLGVEFIAGENLKGVIQMEYGRKEDNYEWGAATYALDGSGASGTVRRAYLEWQLPGLEMPLNFKLGLQEMSLPSFTFGSPVFHAHAAGLVVTAFFSENTGLAAFWSRPLKGKDGLKANNADLLGLVGIWNYESCKFFPWLLYGNIGRNSGFWEYRALHGQTGQPVNPIIEEKYSQLYIAGFAFEAFPLPELGLHLDAMYGYKDSRAEALGFGGNNLKLGGWLAAFLLDYKLDWGTPGLLAWYASGDKADKVADGRLGRLPVGQGSSDGFAPTRLAFPGAVSCGDDTRISYTGVGTWGLGLQVTELSFVENLRHALRLVYVQGSNDKNLRGAGVSLGVLGDQLYLTTEDSFVEFDVDSEWRFSDNLSAYLELGYVMADFSRETAGGRDADLWNAQLTLRFEF